jgi:hypothetical protein
LKRECGGSFGDEKWRVVYRWSMEGNLAMECGGGRREEYGEECGINSEGKW